MQNNAGININDLHTYIEKIAKKALLQTEAFESVATGTIQESLQGYYTIQLTNSTDTGMYKAWPIYQGTSFQKDDYVYLLKAPVSQGSLSETKYYIFGLVGDVTEDYANASDLERFEALERSQLSSVQSYNFFDEEQVKSPIFTIDDTDNSMLLEDIQEQGHLLLLGNFYCQNAISGGNYGLQVTFTDKHDNKIIEKLDINHFSGQPYNLDGSIKQYRIIDIKNSQDIKRIDVQLFTENLSEENRAAIFKVDQVQIQVGSLVSAGVNTTVSISTSKGSKNYFRMANDDTDSVSLTATMYYNSQPLFSNEIKYYWFVENSEITDSEEDAAFYHAYAGPGWQCLNLSDAATILNQNNQLETVNTIRIWKATDNTISFTSENFTKYKNKVKCIATYKNAIVSSEEFIVLNYKNHDFSLRMTTTDSTGIIINAEGKITLTCEVLDENQKRDNSDFKYQWYIRDSELSGYNTNQLIVKDSGTETTNKVEYEIKESDGLEMTFKCKVSLGEGEDTTEIGVVESNTIKTYVSIENVLKQVNYYKYYTSENMSVTFSQAQIYEGNPPTIKTRTSYIPTLDTVVKSEKNYYEYNSTNKEFSKVDIPNITDLKNYYEPVNYSFDWNIDVEDGDNKTTAWIEKFVDDSDEYYSEELTYNNLLNPTNEIFENNNYLYYTKRAIWWEGKAGIYEIVKIEDWQMPSMLCYRNADGSLVNGPAVEKINTFNQLTNGGNEQGVLMDNDKKLYINASFIKTGALIVGSETNPLFKADIDNGGTVDIAGFTVNETSISKTIEDTKIYFGTEGITIGDKFNASVDKDGSVSVSITGDLSIIGTNNETTTLNTKFSRVDESIKAIGNRRLWIVYSASDEKPSNKPSEGTKYEPSESGTPNKDNPLWHTALADGDRWQSQRVANALDEAENTDKSNAWSDVIQISGKDGDAAPTLQLIYKYSDTTPSTPKGENPSEWYPTEPTPVAGQRLYMSQKMSNQTDWSIPVPMTGLDGVDGVDGSTPEVTIGEDGYWYINGEQSIKAEGKDGEDGITPTVTIDPNTNKWVINGTPTDINATGPAGKDGTDIEYVYYRSQDAIRDWKGKEPNAEEKNNWKNSAQGITDIYKYEYMSVRTKPAGNETSWGDFSIPVIWSKWGEKGQDGDGVEYKYKVYSEKQTFTSVPTIDTSWKDEPQGVNSTNKYEYVCQLKYDGETETSTTSIPKLWNEYVSSPYTLSIDEDFISVPCDNSGAVSETFTMPTIYVSLYNGQDQQTPDISKLIFSQNDYDIASKGVDLNNNKIPISLNKDQIKADRMIVKLQYKDSSKVLAEAMIEIVKQKAGDDAVYIYALADVETVQKSELITYPTEFDYNEDGYPTKKAELTTTYLPQQINIELYEKKGSNTPTKILDKTYYWQINNNETMLTGSFQTIDLSGYNNVSKININIYEDEDKTKLIDKVSIDILSPPKESKKIVTYLRKFTWNQWQTYGRTGHNENWLVRWIDVANNEIEPKPYLADYIKKGDTAYITGVVTDINSGSGPAEIILYGTVTEVNVNGIRMTTSHYIMSGAQGIQGQPGKAAPTITKEEYFYYENTSKSSPPTTKPMEDTEDAKNWKTEKEIYSNYHGVNNLIDFTPTYIWKTLVTTFNNETQQTWETPVLVPELEACTNAAKYQIVSGKVVKWRTDSNNNPIFTFPEVSDGTDKKMDITSTIGEHFPSEAPEGDIGRWCSLYARTIMTGGAIMTGSITADQIAANSITADQIDVDGLVAKNIEVKNKTETIFSAKSGDSPQVTIKAGSLDLSNAKKYTNKIAGWNISENGIIRATAGSSATYEYGLNSNPDLKAPSLVESGTTPMIIFYCKKKISNGNDKYTFYVLEDGSLYVTAAELSGEGVNLDADVRLGDKDSTVASLIAQSMDITLPRNIVIRYCYNNKNTTVSGGSFSNTELAPLLNTTSGAKTITKDEKGIKIEMTRQQNTSTDTIFPLEVKFTIAEGTQDANQTVITSLDKIIISINYYHPGLNNQGTNTMTFKYTVENSNDTPSLSIDTKIEQSTAVDS